MINIRLRVWILLLGFCFFYTAGADESSFEQGLKDYQARNWAQAKDNFEKAAHQHPDEPAVYFDLGLAYFQLDKKGYAVAYWRKALAMAPGLSGPAAALEQAEEKYHFGHIEKSPWALTLHDTFLKVGWNVWLGVLALLMLSSGWIWLSYFQRRKAAAMSESADLPPVSLGQLFLAIAFALAFAGAAGKFFDEQKLRGTVVTTIDIKSAPSDDGVNLASVSEGTEVTVTREHDNWVQINTGEGASGWVKKTDLVLAGKDT